MINSMKILYFVNGLNYKGGIARIVVDKANYLADKFKHDVTICVANNIVESAYPLSHNVKICRFDSENRLDTGLLKKISSVNEDNLSIKEAFDFISDIKQKANEILQGEN